MKCRANEHSNTTVPRRLPSLANVTKKAGHHLASLLLSALAVFASGGLISSCGQVSKESNQSPNQNGILGLQGKTSCRVNPYRPSSFLALTDESAASRSLLPDEVAENLIRRLPGGISARVAAVHQDRLDDGSGLHIPIEFMWNSAPLCSKQFHATAHVDTNGLRIKGRLPTDIRTISDGDLLASVDSSLVTDNIKAGLPDYDLKQEAGLEIRQVEQCWYAEASQLTAAVDVKFSIDSMPYQGLLVRDRLVHLDAQVLHASAKINTYRQNALQPIEEIVVDGMQPTGYLCNDYLIADTEGVQKAFSDSGIFQFEKSDPRFLESTIFAHANDMMQWFLGFDKSAHWSNTQVELRLTFNAKQRTSGPSYLNPSSTSSAGGPVILISDVLQFAGSAPVLKNLATDFDVIAHELSHHIVTRYLPILGGPDLIAVHEGLADFFVFAKTGDACLGETICTDAGSDQCAVENTCLRSGEIRYVLDSRKSDPPHRRSQALSGMLWDLTRSTSLGRSGMVKLVLATLKYLDRDTNFDDVYNELINADRQLNNGSNVCAIRQAAMDHGINAARNSPVCK